MPLTRINTTLLASLMLLGLVCSNDLALARGGGGGGRGGGFGGGERFGGGEGFGGGEAFGGGTSFGGGARFGGGYRDGDGYRDGGGNYGYGAGRGRDDFGNGQGVATPRPSEAALRAGAATDYNWGGTRGALSTDGGLGRVAGSSGAIDRATRAISPAELAEAGSGVRGNYGYSGLFNRGFWGENRDAAWADAAAWGDDWAWGYVGWPALAGWWGVPVSTAPQDYDYGNNITYQNDNVYYGSQPVESVTTYYNQAQALAQSVPVTAAESSNKSDWQPLGVFSLVQGSQTATTTMFQLAVNKKGAIKGTYYNALTQESKPVQGAVDKKNMRVSWSVGNNKNVIYDTGLNNLLQPQSPLLIHYSKSKTQQWTLVRLAQPAGTGAVSGAATK